MSRLRRRPAWTELTRVVDLRPVPSVVASQPDDPERALKLIQALADRFELDVQLPGDADGG